MLFENISNEIQNLESIGKCGGKEINAGKVSKGNRWLWILLINPSVPRQQDKRVLIWPPGRSLSPENSPKVKKSVG
ncbi:hypothetical protein Peur_029629 [Populus x canadensis]